MLRDDYLLRHIEAIAAAVARVTGLDRRDDQAQVVEATDEAWRALLEAPRALIDAVDSRTLAAMLGEPARLRAAVELSAAEGRALAAAGDPRTAGLRYRRALELLLEAHARAPDPRDAAAIHALAAIVPIDALADRYRARYPAQGEAPPGPPGPDR